MGYRRAGFHRDRKPDPLWRHYTRPKWLYFHWKWRLVLPKWKEKPGCFQILPPIQPLKRREIFLNKLPLLSSAMTWRSYAILPLWNLWKSEIPTFYHHRGLVEWLSEFSGESNVQRGIKILVNTQWVILINVLRTILAFKFTGNRYVSVLCLLARNKDHFVRERIDNQRGIEIGSRRIQRAYVQSMLRRIHLTFGTYVSVQCLLGETSIRR